MLGWESLGSRRSDIVAPPLMASAARFPFMEVTIRVLDSCDIREKSSLIVLLLASIASISARHDVLCGCAAADSSTLIVSLSSLAWSSSLAAISEFMSARAAPTFCGFNFRAISTTAGMPSDTVAVENILASPSSGTLSSSSVASSELISVNSENALMGPVAPILPSNSPAVSAVILRKTTLGSFWRHFVKKLVQLHVQLTYQQKLQESRRYLRRLTIQQWRRRGLEQVPGRPKPPGLRHHQTGQIPRLVSSCDHDQRP